MATVKHDLAASLFLLLSLFTLAALASSVISDDIGLNQASHLLQEPCRLVVAAVRFTDGSKEVVSCTLQGKDRDQFGTVDMEIDDLDSTWMQRQSLELSPFGEFYTLFHSEATIDGNKLILQDGQTLDDMELAVHSAEDNHARGLSEDIFRANVEGIRTFLVLRIVFDDAEVSLADIRNEVFNANPNFMGQYSDISFGKLQFKSKDAGGSSDGILDYRIGADISGNRMERLAPMAIDFLTTKDIYDTVDYFLISVPPGTTSQGSLNWLAFAFLFDDPRSKVSFYNDFVLFNAAAIVHELGHNFGLRHSNENSFEYEDTSGVMGFSTYVNNDRSRPRQYKGFNGAKSWQLGWYQNQAIELGPTEIFSGTICGAVDYDIDADTSSYAVLVEIEFSDIEVFYVAFNRVRGFNAQSNEGRDQVLVTHVIGELKRGSQSSSLVGELREGDRTTFRANYLLRTFEVEVEDIAFLDDVKMCARVNIVPISSQPTPTTCTAWEDTSGGELQMDVDLVGAFHFDLVVDEATWLTSIEVEFSYTLPQEIALFFAEGSHAFDENLDWKNILQSDIVGQGQGKLTPLPIFDEAIYLEPGKTYTFALLAVNGVSSVRNSVIYLHPESSVACPSCPFRVSYGLAILFKGDAVNTPFHGKLNFCRYPLLNFALSDFGEDPPTEAFPLRRCQGDCDADSDCGGDLFCFERTTGEDIPACLGNLDTDSDFCVSKLYPRPSQSPSEVPTMFPTTSPTMNPTKYPTTTPTAVPTLIPTTIPAVAPFIDSPVGFNNGPPTVLPAAAGNITVVPREGGNDEILGTNAPTISSSQQFHSMLSVCFPILAASAGVFFVFEML